MKHDTAIPLLRQRPAGTARLPVEASLSRPHAAPVTSLYVHIPFCFHKCHYCDFYSLVDTQDRQQVFVDRLVSELAALAPLTQNHPLKTVFVGGGTPTLLAEPLWQILLNNLHRFYDFSGITRGDGEFTVECNPETASEELFTTLRSGGVNRMSFGAQSFQPGHLKTLERWHNPDNVARALSLAAQAGIPRRSIDLIFGIPGQSLDDWRRDLAFALSLGTTHLSCYGLTYEPGTAMTARLRRGDFSRCDEDLETEMFQETLGALRAAGLERYEVSNFARPGDECRHNLAYWRQDQWLAAGPSASAHIAGHRWKNMPRLDDYLAISDNGFAPIVDHEPPDAARALTERIMTGLRLAEGLETTFLLEATARARGDHAATRLRAAIEHQISRGLIQQHPAQTHPAETQSATTHPATRQPVETHAVEAHAARWRLTDAGFLVADAILVDLLVALDDPRASA